MTLKPQASQRVLKGQRLIQQGDVLQQTHGTVGSVVVVKSNQGKFLGQLVYAPQQKGIGWIFSTDESDRWSQSFVQRAVERAFDKRRRLVQDATTTAYRLVNGEGDQLAGVTVDYYAGFLQLNWYSEGMYRYRDWVVDSLQQALPTVRGMYETLRFGEAKIQHIMGELAPQPLHIMENGVEYAIYLGEEWMTGIFLDQRQVRSFIADHAHHQSVLNLFSYTGAFSVAATKGGANRTVSVDVAKRSLAKTQENFQLNGIESPTMAHEIRVQDVFDYIKMANRKGWQFDWVVCDPPSFARTKKVVFSARKDYVALAQALAPLVAANGSLMLSTNHSGYFLQDFMQEMRQALAQTGSQWQLVQQFGLSEDFPTTQDANSQYLKVLVFRKLAE